MLVVISCLLVVASLPLWLPRVVVALRMRVFARVNGTEGITVPGDLDAACFKEIYAHQAANGRSRGAALSDLFWYWLSPGAEVHQEHLEPGERYDEVARATRSFLALPARDTEDLATRCAAGVLEGIDGIRPVRLRDLMMPIWADFYYELVFDEPCPAHARELVVGNADDVVTALKCCGPRHMDRRDRLTRYLAGRVDDTRRALPASLSTGERALYLQGTFFNTAVVQMSEAMSHLLMVLARHPDIQARIAAGDMDHLDRVMEETFRLYPLFGIAHRITSADIAVDGCPVIPAGSVLCFDYPAFHRTGFPDSERFDPSRWETLSTRRVNHIPFGMAANRPCPAWRLAPLTMRVVTREVLRRFTLCTSAAHTRSIPNRGPCLLVARSAPPGPRTRALLAAMWLRDRGEDVTRSVAQLAYGSYMVWDARRQRLCTRYFETDPEFTMRVP